MTLDQVFNQAWTRKHDNPAMPKFSSVPRIVFPRGLEDLIKICSTRQPNERLHAAGSHWALSAAAIADHTFIETHDPSNVHQAMGKTLFDVIPNCMNDLFIAALAQQTIKPFDVDTVSENEGLWIHGSNIWPIVGELTPRFGGPTEVELYDRLAEVPTRGDLIVGIIQLAIGWADAFDEDVMEVLKHYAKHEDSRVRSAVVQGLLFNKWPQGLPILKDLADNDEAVDVRDFASKAFENVTKAQSETT
jgi:hypothetical protein